MPPKKQADNSAMKELKRALREGTLERLYVFHGEESYLREHYLGQLKAALLPPGLEEFNLHTIQGTEFTPDWLAQVMDCLPMMSQHTLVVVTDYDLYGGAAAGREKLLALLEDIPDYCCVVFVYDLLPYKADARTKMAALLKKRGKVVPFHRQDQGDLVSWIARRFKALDHDIDSADAKYLLFLCGDLMTRLAGEIGKIGAYARHHQITREDIDAVAIPQLDAVVFQMTDAIARRKFDQAAAVLSQLMSMRESPVMILAVMGKNLRQLYSARLALEAGRGRDYLMELWAMRSAYPADKLMDAARGFTLPWCRSAVRRCMEVDLAMKSTGADPQELLVSFLLELSIPMSKRRGLC